MAYEVDVWIIISCKYSLYTKGILIKYLSLLLLTSVFLIKLNRLSPENGVSLFASPIISMNPNATHYLFFVLFFSWNPTQTSRSCYNTIPIEFLLNMDFEVTLMAVFSESSNLSVSSNLSLSHLNYITCYFLYYLLKTINTFSLLS